MPASVAPATQIRLLPHAVLRAAAWPIETLAPFAAPALADAARALDAAEARVLARRDALADRLHAAVPRVSDRRARAYLLAVRRAVHAGSGPLPARPAAVTAALLAVADLASAPPEPQPPATPGRSAATSAADLLAAVDAEAAERAALARDAAAFEAAHAAALAGERVALRAATTDARFRKALLLAHPAVAERWAAAADDPDSARGRRLEATVFHYLLRAAGRPTPQGAWAGVTLVRPAAEAAPAADSPAAGDAVGAALSTDDRANELSAATRSTPDAASAEGLELRVAPAAPRYVVSVSLLPFAIMLDVLAATPRYRQEAPLRRNPTLFASGDGWRYEARTDAGYRWTTLPPHPLYAALLRYYADGEARPVAPLLEAVGAAEGGAAARSRLEQAVAALLDRDALQVDLALPPAAPDAWTALAAVAPRLLPADCARWSAAVVALQDACARLGAAYPALTVEGLDEQRQAIEAAVQALWQDLGLPGRAPGPLLQVDHGLPFAAAWTAANQARLAAAVAELLAFHAADGGAELYRREALRPLAAAGVGASETPLLALLASERLGAADGTAWGAGAPAAACLPDTRQEVFARFPPRADLGAAVAAQCAAWEARLAPVAHEPAHTLPADALAPDAAPGLGGALLVALGAGGTVWLGTGRPQPGLFAARFGALLAGADGDDLVARDLRGWAADLAARGVVPAEVVGPDAANPNAALRPAVAPATIDPHGPPDRALANLTLTLDAAGRPWLRRAGGHAWLLPVYNSAVLIGQVDPCSRLLPLLAMGHGWEFLSFGFPALPAERQRWGHLPRLRLPGGAILARERWTLDEATVARLRALRGAARYRAWQAEVARRGLPARVLVRRGLADPEQLLPTDSPLAVRCLFDTLPADLSWLTLSELPGDPTTWPLRDAAGGHYLAELAVTWYAPDYAPSGRGPATLAAGQGDAPAT